MTTVSEENMVKIPDSIVRQLDLKPGTGLDWQLAENGTVIVQKRGSRAEQAEKLLGIGRSCLKSKFWANSITIRAAISAFTRKDRLLEVRAENVSAKACVRVINNSRAWRADSFLTSLRRDRPCSCRIL